MPSQRPYSELRASDAERERVVAFLREHALQGRLDNDELEERIGLAYAAVTVGDLERLIADLPRPVAARARAIAARPHRATRRHEPNPALIVAGVAAAARHRRLRSLIVAGVLALIAIVSR